MEGKSGILFLSHQGFSFLEDLTRLAGKLGFESYILSSNPCQNAHNRIDHISSLGQWLRVTKNPSLTRADVFDALTSLSDESRKVVACMSVWEGYRLLVAEANATLGANDESKDTLELLLDKYRLRNELIRFGLSRVSCSLLTEDVFEGLKLEEASSFVKPRIGLGSFGAFRVSAQSKWSEILALQSEMKEDLEYASVFERSGDFIVEDYIPGVELSFETLVLDGKAFFLAVHEKLELEQWGCSTMENTSVSPPVSLDAQTVKAGESYVSRCLGALGVQTGCYHIEAKYDSQQRSWEIIEFNPRVGGALIKESVFESTGGVELIEEWMKILTLDCPLESRRLSGRLSLLAQSPDELGISRSGTFFRVFFGKPGRRIAKIHPAVGGPAPHLMKIAVTEGTELSNSSHEIFLGQALWKLPIEEMEQKVFELQELSKNALEVQYA